jgi:NAD(P)-dependent dehydrogenase (short-subunit alcohol dehydrogenase family)
MAHSPRFDFSGTAAVVTGGTRGVGRGIAEALLAAGADVVVCGRTPPAATIVSAGREAVFVTADLREPEAAEAVVDAAVVGFGRLDLLVNNAGGSPQAAADSASPRFLSSVVALNLLAPFYMAQRANAVMQDQPDGGVIVNIGSVSGLRPSPGTAAYGAAKAGLANLTRTLAVEWAPLVRVNCVTAGMVRTEQAHLHYGGDAGVAAIAATVPLGRLAEPADVAAACLFLASPLASYVSGTELVLHGGGERPAFLSAANTDRGLPQELS